MKNGNDTKSGVLVNDTNTNLASKQEDSGNKWGQLGLLFLGTSFFGNGTLGINKAILTILLKSFGFNAAMISLVQSARGVKAIVDLFAGYIGDKYGRKTIAYIGQLFLVLTYSIYGLLTFCQPVFLYPGFILGGMVNGIGSGFNAGAATFGAADLMKRSRALGQALLECANFASMAIISYFAILLYKNVGHSAPFLILGMMPILGFIIVKKFLKEPSTSKKHVPTKETFKFLGKMITNPKMIAVYYAGFLTKFADDGILNVLLSLYAYDTLENFGLSVPMIAAGVAGIAILAQIAFTVTIPFAGLLSDKIGRKFCMVLGTLLIGSSVLFMPHISSVLLMNIIGITVGIGNAFIYPSAPAATADVVPDELRATGMGVYKFTHDLGIFIGPLLFGLLKQYLGVKYASFGGAAIVFFGTLLLLIFFKESKNLKNSGQVSIH